MKPYSFELLARRLQLAGLVIDIAAELAHQYPLFGHPLKPAPEENAAMSKAQPCRKRNLNHEESGSCNVWPRGTLKIDLELTIPSGSECDSESTDHSAYRHSKKILRMSENQAFFQRERDVATTARTLQKIAKMLNS